MRNVKLNLLFVTILVVGIVFIGCDRRDESPARPATLKFLFSESSISGNLEEEEPAVVSYTIDVGGAPISYELTLHTTSNGYETSAIPFPAGDFHLKEFAILSSSKLVLYESPQAGSSGATRVEKPMPLAFETIDNTLTELKPEVLAAETVDVLNFHISATRADGHQQLPVDYALEVIAKDAPLGNVLWRRTFSLLDNRIVTIPDGYAHYSFIASKPEYISHAQYYKRELLEDVDALSFEFIPESLEGFETSGSVVRFYLPDNQNMCKLYARIDVAEGYELLVVYGDRSGFSDPWGKDLGEAAFAEDPSYRVNIFGNVPYAQAPDFCATFDLSRDNRVKSLDDIQILTYTFCDVYNPNDPTIGFVDKYRVFHGRER